MSFKEILKNDPSIQELDGTLFHVNNGDLKALDKIKTEWKFKDKESVFRYALAVMVQADSHTLYIDKAGSINSLAPNASLLEEETTEEEEEKSEN